jgi:hypothetical protein
MDYWSQGGLEDLAHKLGLDGFDNLAKTGSCNSRIIRTTLRDSYCTTQPSLYIIGLTFLTRHELPVATPQSNDGKWLSLNSKLNLLPSLDAHVSRQDIERYCGLWDRFTALAVEDLAQTLQYQLLSLCDSLEHRGHRCVIFNTAEYVLDWVIDKPAFGLLQSKKQLVQGLRWKSIPWQFEQGAKWLSVEDHMPLQARHVAPGQHQWLNKFLIDHINQQAILQ